MKKIWHNFKNFFLNYFWMGIVLILLSIIITEALKLNGYWEILAKLIETIGIAIFIASLFSWTFESVSFQNRMEKIVEKIVLKRTFLKNLTKDKKKEALHSLLQPTENEIEKYSNIGKFYDYFSGEVLEVSQKNIRSNYAINAKVKYCDDNKVIYSDGTYSYRLYPSENGYTPITVGFLKEDEISTVDVFINLPNGERKEYKYNEIEDKFEEKQDSRVTKIDIDEFCKDFDHVDVELRVREYGFNHWLNVFFKAEQATDGFKFMLSCEDNISIQTYNLFDVGHNYHIDLSEDKKELHISCYQWINEGAGLSIITSQPEVNNA